MELSDEQAGVSVLRTLILVKVAVFLFILPIQHKDWMSAHSISRLWKQRDDTASFFKGSGNRYSQQSILLLGFSKPPAQFPLGARDVGAQNTWQKEGIWGEDGNF